MRGRGGDRSALPRSGGKTAAQDITAANQPTGKQEGCSSSVTDVTKGSCTLQDLCPADKQKVAGLLKQVVDLGQRLRQAQEAPSDQELRSLQEANQQLSQENANLKKKTAQMLRVLRAYQSKVEFLTAQMATLHSTVPAVARKQQTAQQAAGGAQAGTDACSPHEDVADGGLASNITEAGNGNKAGPSVSSTAGNVHHTSTTGSDSATTLALLPACSAQQSAAVHAGGTSVVTIPVGGSVSITIQHQGPQSVETVAKESWSAQQAEEPMPVQGSQQTSTQLCVVSSSIPSQGLEDATVQPAAAVQPTAEAFVDSAVTASALTSEQQGDGQPPLLTVPAESTQAATQAADAAQAHQSELTNPQGREAAGAVESTPQAGAGAGEGLGKQSGREVVVRGDVLAAAAAAAEQVEVQDIHPSPSPSGPVMASPLLVAPEGLGGAAAASLMRWQLQHGFLPRDADEGGAVDRVLRFDPSIGKHGAFYFADVAPPAGTPPRAWPQPQALQFHALTGPEEQTAQDEQLSDTLSDLSSELTLSSFPGTPLTHHGHSAPAHVRGAAHITGQGQMQVPSTGGRGGALSSQQSSSIHPHGSCGAAAQARHDSTSGSARHHPTQQLARLASVLEAPTCTTSGASAPAEHGWPAAAFKATHGRAASSNNTAGNMTNSQFNRQLSQKQPHPLPRSPLMAMPASSNGTPSLDTQHSQHGPHTHGSQRTGARYGTPDDGHDHAPVSHIGSSHGGGPRSHVGVGRQPGNRYAGRQGGSVSKPAWHVQPGSDISVHDQAAPSRGKGSMGQVYAAPAGVRGSTAPHAAGVSLVCDGYRRQDQPFSGSFGTGVEEDAVQLNSMEGTWHAADHALCQGGPLDGFDDSLMDILMEVRATVVRATLVCAFPNRIPEGGDV